MSFDPSSLLLASLLYLSLLPVSYRAFKRKQAEEAAKTAAAAED